MSTLLNIKSITKKYGGTIVLDGVSIDVDKGNFLTILGPSGSGKTTLLMIIAGFTQQSSGELVIDGKDITDMPPERRNFGMVFQGYALFPHMTVAQNVGFSLNVRGWGAAAIRDRVKRVLDMVQLGAMTDRLPKQLSGGQQQRVAIARALAFEPDLLLLDEPLSALDKKLRLEVQSELRDLHQRLGMTFVCVTHDQEEALSLSDDIAILRAGRLEQIGSPVELYEAPRSRFVADFLGRSNFMEVNVLRATDQGFHYRFGEGSFLQARGNFSTGDTVFLALRPEKLRLSSNRPPDAINALQGTILNSTYSGAQNHVVVEIGQGRKFNATVPTDGGRINLMPGVPVWVSWDPSATVSVRDD